MTMQDIRSLNMAKIKELQSGAASSGDAPAAAGATETTPEKTSVQPSEAAADVPKVTLKKQLVATVPLVRMNKVSESGEPVFLLHSIEGDVDNLSELGSQLKRSALGIQRTAEVPIASIEELAVSYIPVSITTSYLPKHCNRINKLRFLTFSPGVITHHHHHHHHAFYKSI